MELINKNAHKIQVQRDQFETFGQSMIKEIHTTVEKASDRHYKKLQFEEDASVPQIQGLATIRSEGTNGIIKVLSLKADKTEVDRLDELK